MTTTGDQLRVDDGHQETVADWLTGAPVTPQRAGLVAGSLAAGLSALHAAGITAEPVPRRLKLNKHGVALVPPSPGDLTAPDPAYAAPERLQGGDPTPAGDAYAVAAIFFALLTGRPPFGTGDQAALRALTETAPELTDVPARAAELIRRGLDRDPAARPSAAELARELATVLSEGPLDQPTLPPTAPTETAVPAGSGPAAVGTPPGRALGSQYVLEEVIGSGATGRVWRARRRDGGDPVAVKVLREEFSLEPDAVVRFLRERTTLRSISHPHLVRVHDLVAEGDTMAVVMDLVDGDDLRTVTRQAPLTRGQALTILGQVAGALAAVHAAGVVHRDVKPENVLVDRESFARLTDFGLAWVSSSPALTRSSQLVGTPAYVAPELVAGRRASTAVDIYALGVMAYELLAGHRPFVADSTAALLQAHLDAEPERPASWSDDLWQLVAACLAKAPDRRPSAEELAAGFDAVSRGLPIAPLGSDDPGLPLTWAPPNAADRVPAPVPLESAVMSLPSATSRPGTGSQPTTGATRPDPPVPVEAKPKRPWWRRRRTLVLAGVLCALAGSGTGLWLGRPEDPPATQNTPPPPLVQTYVVQVSATSAKPGVIRLQFSDEWRNRPGFQGYVIFRDGHRVDQPPPDKDASPYVYLAPDRTVRHCYKVLALMEIPEPQQQPVPGPACLAADGKQR